ncbi:MAG: pyridoxal-phosphate-dependent aminotransferase family protein [Myxococcota bacterium]
MKTSARRILLGPGPSNVDPRVREALSAPLLGHLDPEFLAIADETQDLLRRTFRTSNPITFPVSGTGSAGMESCFVNLVEPGDPVLVCVNGVFGTRMVDVAERCGAAVTKVEAPWGRAVDPEDVARAVKKSEPKIIALVHAETSTGALTPVPPIAGIARDCGALLLVDTVTSLAGIPVEVDGWGIDACYSGTQKCLSCPPGLAPASYSPRALRRVLARKTKVASWYLDLTLLTRYWGKERVYHHTAPVSMIFALRAALQIVLEEGLAARWARHDLNHRALAAGLEAMNLALVVPAAERLPQLNAVAIPAGVDDLAVRQRLLDEFKIEIGAGLGVFSGKVWRVGLMGYSASRDNVIALLEALEVILPRAGHRFSPGAAVRAAEEIYP